jgi:hypothetical protein
MYNDKAKNNHSQSQAVAVVRAQVFSVRLRLVLGITLMNSIRAIK